MLVILRLVACSDQLLGASSFNDGIAKLRHLFNLVSAIVVLGVVLVERSGEGVQLQLFEEKQHLVSGLLGLFLFLWVFMGDFEDNCDYVKVDLHLDQWNILLLLVFDKFEDFLEVIHAA